MASMSRCIVCKECKFPQLKCEIYAPSIFSFFFLFFYFYVFILFLFYFIF